MGPRTKKNKPTSKVARLKSLAKKAVPARKSSSKHKARTMRSASLRTSENYMNYSGKFTVRLPRSLHQALVDRAEKEGVSLNLFVTNALSRTVAISSHRK